MKLLRKINNKVRQINYKYALNECLETYSSGYLFAFIPQGLGDILYFCMYIRAFRKKMYPNKGLVLIATKKHFIELMQLFEEEIDSILVIDMELFKMEFTDRFTYYYPLIYESGIYSKTLKDSIRTAMKLTEESEIYIPQIKFDNYSYSLVKNIVNSKKNVLISPDATSCSKIIPDTQWEELANMFRIAGYNVLFNVSEKDNRFVNYKHVFYDLKTTILLCNCINLFVGYRSGLCDVVAAFCKCKQIVIYPNDRKKGEFRCIYNYDENPNEKYLEYSSLKLMNPTADVEELIYDHNNFYEQIGVYINGEDIN